MTDSMVRGYHVYKDIWTSQVGEILPCVKERHNVHDPFAVAVKKGANVVGHIPRSMSTVYVFLGKHQSKITCKVTGDKRYSRDLPQGGLEVPCQQEFKGEECAVKKVSLAVAKRPHDELKNSVPRPVSIQLQETSEPKAKKFKRPDESGEPSCKALIGGDCIWVRFGKLTLTKKQREKLGT